MYLDVCMYVLILYDLHPVISVEFPMTLIDSFPFSVPGEADTNKSAFCE